MHKAWLGLLLFCATGFADPCHRSFAFLGGTPRLTNLLSPEFAGRFSGEDRISRQVEDLIQHASWGGWNRRHLTDDNQILHLAVTPERRTLGVEIDYFHIAGASLVETAPSGAVLAKLLASISRGIHARLADRPGDFTEIRLTANYVINPQLKALLTSLGFRPRTIAGRLAFTLNPWMYRTGRLGVDLSLKLTVSPTNETQAR